MAQRRQTVLDEIDGASSPASKINLVIGIVVGLLVIGSALVNYGKQTSLVDQVSQKVDATTKELSAKVEAASQQAQAKVETLTAKVDATSTLAQAKTDALTKVVEINQADQQTFRTSVQGLFSKVFDSQAALSAQVNQERVDRLTEAAKKK